MSPESVLSNSTVPDAPGRVLLTLEMDGSRHWINPRLATGRFWHRRRAVAYALIALFTLIPFARIGGKPVLLLDVIHRRFSILGASFLPTDMGFLALFLLIWIVSIFLFTALLGRVWCGWICPQTVYMEFLFRPIERLFMGRAGRGGKAAGTVAGWRTVAMYVTYAAVCVHLANTFLAYFVPPEVLNRWITSSPAAHPAGFAIVLAVAAGMMFNFAWFREQTCVIACPYGRLQSVLLDRQSLIIGYDAIRGEPRSRKVASEGAEGVGRHIALPVLEALESPGLVTRNSQPATHSGDCVDCTMCVQVCPTGIDIRQGLQVECVACAQCIDACDTVMDKIGRPRGLIRYASQAGMAGEKTRMLRPRVVIYAGLVAGLFTLLASLLLTRSTADVTLLRNVGRPFVIQSDGQIENTFQLKITNRTDTPQSYRISAINAPEVHVELTGVQVLIVAPRESETCFGRVLAPVSRFAIGYFDVTLRLTGADGAAIDQSFRLLGPARASATPATAPSSAGDSYERK